MRYIIFKIIFFLLISPLFSAGQKTTEEDWIRVFWEPEKTSPRAMIETYDHGYMLDMVVRPDLISEKWTWLVKTDINGNVLWEKNIGNGIDIAGFHDVHQTPDGGYVLSGATNMLDEIHGDTFFMKLNACGEKEWCRIFHLAGQYTAYDFGVNIYPLDDGSGYIALVMQWGDEFIPGTGVSKGIWLFKLDNEGNSVWIKNVFDEVHPDAWAEQPKRMLMSGFKTPDGLQKVIITGTTIYNDYGLPYGWHKTMVCSADVEGNELWWAIFHQDSPYLSDAQNLTEDKNGNVYTVGRDENYMDNIFDYYPALFKTDPDGDTLMHKYFIDNTEAAQSFCIQIINDTILDIGGIWRYPGQPEYASIARVDTNGNLILDKQIWEGDFGLYRSIKTFDNKELFIGMFKDNDGKRKVYLHKFNSDLEYDSIYTQPMEYDYMCEELPIVSDTIDICDCAVWTILPSEIEYRMSQYLVVYPNPATTEITVRLPRYTAENRSWGEMTSRHFNAKYHENSVLYIYNIYGENVKEIPLRDVIGEEVKADISALSPGIYMINLYEKNRKMAGGKFVIRR